MAWRDDLECTSNTESALTEGAARVPHPGRRVPDAQPEPVEYPGSHATQRWSVSAIAERQMTGKAVGWMREAPRSFRAASKDAVLAMRATFIDAYLHAPQRAFAAKRPASEGSAKPAEQREQRPRRAAAPRDLTDGFPRHIEPRRGPLPGRGRAGPGRGHTLERTAASAAARLEEQWKEQWQTAKMEELERERDSSLRLYAAQESTIASLLERRTQLEDALLRQAGLSLASGLGTGAAVLPQPSHAAQRELAHEAGVTEVAGVGRPDLPDSQGPSLCLMDRQLAELSACLREAAGADAAMAERLVDLLHAAVHAGEGRLGSAAPLELQCKPRLCAAVTDSLAEFVSQLHAAGGSGRDADEAAEAMQASAAPAATPATHLARTVHELTAMLLALPPVARSQVIATAVSNASARHGVSFRDIGERLGLSAELIGKGKERFDMLLVDGKWESE